MIVRIPKKYLEEIYVHCERIPSLYFHPSKFARDFFWKRLEIASDFIKRYANHYEACMDFGCGNGVLLPTLSPLFDKVTAVDIETREATQVIDRYQLQNVSLLSGDAHAMDLPAEVFDVVTALDVLEHFKDPLIPIEKIKQSLKPGGFLITSLPTENFFTVWARRLSGTKKPFDHYHTGAEVENILERSNMKKVETVMFAWYCPMYIISVWKK